jgi:hypothetical protein
MNLLVRLEPTTRVGYPSMAVSLIVGEGAEIFTARRKMAVSALPGSA